MKKRLLLSVCALLLCLNYSSKAYFTFNNIDFGDVTVGSPLTKTFDISPIDRSVIVKDYQITGNYNSFSLLNFQASTIPVGSKMTIAVECNPKHNLALHSTLYIRFKVNQAEFTEAIELTANAKYASSLYDFSQNKSGSALMSALKTFVNTGFVSYSYKDARTMFWSSFDNVGGEVECVYTGRKVATTGIPDVNTTKFNTEHTWPQAYGADNEPPKSDMYHMYPTYEAANSKRANLPFGFVAGTANYEDNGSKLGRNASNAIIFEARDAHKGNVARSIFYFCTKYGNGSNFLDRTQEADLRKYMTIDPVDSREQARCDSIAKYQKNHNPYVDHPEFVDRIYQIGDTADFPASINAFAIDTALVYNKFVSLTQNVYFYNLGNQTATVETAEITGTNKDMFALPDYFAQFSIAANTSAPLPITIVDGAAADEMKTAQLKIKFTNGQAYTVNLYAHYPVSSVNDEAENFVKVYPNPINDNSILEFPIESGSAPRVMIFDNAGKQVADLSNAVIINSTSAQVKLNKSVLNSNTGVYHYQIILDSKVYKGKLILN